MKKKSKTEQPVSTCNCRDFIIGIFAMILSAFFLFTEKGKNLFIPFKDEPGFLNFYFYLISYTLIIVGIFFILRGFGFIGKKLSKI